MKRKHRKLFLHFVVSQINNVQMASQIVEHVLILIAITWLQTAWKSITQETIDNSCKNVDLTLKITQEANEEINTGFQVLFEQISAKITIDEYIDWDAEIVTPEPADDPLMVDWRKVSLNNFIAKVVHNSKDVGGIDESWDELEDTNDREMNMTGTRKEEVEA